MAYVHPDSYKLVPKCTECGKCRGWRIEKRNAPAPCTCSGYHFPHRKGSPYCDFHPRAAYNQAKRNGVPDDDIPLEYLGTPMDNNSECPF